MNNRAANHSRMRHRNRVVGNPLLLQPGGDSGDQLQNGLATMWSGTWVSQPRDDFLRVALLNFGECAAAPNSVIAIAQLDRDLR